ncbi:MAG: ergothioneine biosynthesis protein EgtB [Betaproteobacteria bacterium]|nr:MAG: ergothioneine biosynthesis protein EgtB [Betaproteobacteria bacterium]
MTPQVLAAELHAARARTHALTADLEGEREFGPRLAIVNPPRWELGHVGWFQEYWCLRRVDPDRFASARAASILPQADRLYNSATVPHDTRWSLPLPDFGATRAYCAAVLARTVERLERRCDADDAYFAQLALRHEDMHAEAFHYTRQTLGYEAPPLAGGEHPAGERVSGDAEIQGGTFALGAAPGAGFAFDNEKWSHPVTLGPFRMARAAVSNAEYEAFVEEGGYRRRELWSEAGWRWLAQSGREAPLYWKREGRDWRLRRFDRWVALPTDEPVTHVNWYEAVAYCRYAGRRLPTEAEWEFAACWDARAGRKRRNPWGDEPWTPQRACLSQASLASVHAYPEGDSPWGIRQMIGNAWEWTASAFQPYPGFSVDPYQEYSAPWFGTHQVLRGGAFTTSPRIGYGGYRNFFTPERADVFAGFRTCALEAA